jgi:hypothetical protein
MDLYMKQIKALKPFLVAVVLIATPSAGFAQGLPCEWDEDTLTTWDDVSNKTSEVFSRYDLNLNLMLGAAGHRKWAFKGAVGLQFAYLWPIFPDLEALCSEDAGFYFPVGIGPQVSLFTTFTEAYAQTGLRFVSSLEGQGQHWRVDLGAVGGTDFDGDLGMGPSLAVGWGLQPFVFLLRGHYAFGLDRPLLIMASVSFDIPSIYYYAQEL